jgi:hypothetical protein
VAAHWKRPRRKLLGLGALVAMAISFAAPQAAGAKQADFSGIVSEDVFAGDPGYQDVQLTQQRSLGFQLIRQTFRWSDIETSPGTYNFGAYDSYVAALSQHGMHVLPILFGPPPFRSSGPPNADPRGGTYAPARYEDLGDFAAAVVRRYGPNGSFWSSHPSVPYLPIKAWQVWNEPNLKYYWASGPSPAGYAALLKVTSAAIRSVDPSAEVVTAGLPDSNKGMAIDRFIKGMYKAGAGPSFNTLATNPYGKDPKQVLARVAKVRSVMNKSGGKRARIWITEMGWATGGPKGPYTVAAKKQAKLIGDTLKLLRKQRSKLKLRGIVYFNWKDAPPYDNRSDFWGLHTGLIDQGGKPKPALKALQSVLKNLS